MNSENIGFTGFINIGDKFSGIVCRNEQKTRCKRVEGSSVSDLLDSELLPEVCNSGKTRETERFMDEKKHG